MRSSGRTAVDLRQITLQADVSKHAEGSCLAKFGDTHVLCTASLEDRVPPFLRNSGRGWITAEYGMLPRSTNVRTDREAARGRQSGRTQEIQRLIGRSLRAVVQLDGFGERQVRLDCDVVQADGGTRTASICGGFVALHDAFTRMLAAGDLKEHPITDRLAAVSVGIVDGEARLDLPYEEDAIAEVDLNVVMTGSGDYVEVQGTAEGEPFARDRLDVLLDLAAEGIATIAATQRDLLIAPPAPRP